MDSKEKSVYCNPTWRKQLTSDLFWGVYPRDCYGLTKDIVNELLIKTFEDYGEALDFAKRIGKNSAIHLTNLMRDHKGEK